jgi:geranylgeranylglycerol-phosphate geranylgeranyltransferase
MTIFIGVIIFSGDEIDIGLAIIAGLCGGLIDAGGNIINDYFDIEIDRINKPERPLPSGSISKGGSIALYIMSTSAGIILSLNLDPISSSIVIFSAIMLFLYSFRLKFIPLVGNLTIAFMTGLAFIFAGSVAGNFKDSLIPASFAFLINLGREIMKDIEDMDGDMRCGVRTFPIVSGIERAILMINLTLALLILITPLPYLLKFYNFYYLITVIFVDLILIYVILSLLRDRTKRNLNRLSNVLKFEMVAGLFAIYIGQV